MRQSRRKEKQVESRVCARALNELQVPSIKMKPGANTGWPDQLFFLGGGAILMIEFKEPGFTPEPRQEYIHAMFKGMGYDVQVHTTEDEALRSIKRAKEMGAAPVPKEGGKVPAAKRSRRATP